MSGLPQLTGILREGGKIAFDGSSKNAFTQPFPLAAWRGIAKIINFDLVVGLFVKRHYSVSEMCIPPPCSHALTLSEEGERKIYVLAAWCYCKNPLLGEKIVSKQESLTTQSPSETQQQFWVQDSFFNECRYFSHLLTKVLNVLIIMCSL